MSSSAGAFVEGIELVRFMLLGAPRTKKNHSRVIRLKGKGGTRILPSEQHERWFGLAVPQARLVAARLCKPIGQPIGVAAVFYRDAERGDLCGYLQALGDLLEAAGIIEDDKWIASWDGSRLGKDAGRPRIEVIISKAC